MLDAGGWVGGTDRLEPIEAALSALAACINVGITINAAASGVDIDHLETRVRTDFDPAVLFSLEGLDEADSVSRPSPPRSRSTARISIRT